MACARCGCGVYQTEDIITLNKIWHKCCFTCYKCKKRLDKCTAKIFQGEVFCESCYNCLLEELELLSSSSNNNNNNKPCRVVSSPNCICEKENSRPIKILPPLDKCKKCRICFQAKQNKVKKSRSCSCLPDKKSGSNKKGFYCFAFPLPREVANYYNRAQTMPKRTPINCCPTECPRCRSKKRSAPQQCIKMSSLSQQSQPMCPTCRQNNFSCAHCRQDDDRPLSPTPSPPSGCCCSTPMQRYSATQPPPQQCYPPNPSQPPQPEKCRCPRCCPPPRCKAHSSPSRSPYPKRSPTRRKPCPPCCPANERKPEVVSRKPQCRCCSAREEKNSASCASSNNKMSKYCPCGNVNPCDCKMCQVRAVCTPICNRCGDKVYAAEKISVTKGAYHTSCFSCYCCRKLLDVRNVHENCGEIYCKQCYNNLFGNQFYGYGSS